MIACFDIGGSFIRYGIAAPDGMVTEAGRVATPGHDFDLFCDALNDALTAMGTAPDAVVSISIPGVFDPATGISTLANVNCCHGRKLADDLSEALGRPVSITNDADCYALAEARLGAGRGHRNVFAIILGSGVGGGLVLNGTLVQGHGGIAGEWGHGPVVDPTAGGLTDRIGPIPCGCGLVGCLDPVGSARGLERIDAKLNRGSRDSLAILAAWKEGEAEAGETVTIYVEHVARALSVMKNTFGPSIIPAGGGLAGNARLIAAIDERVRGMVLGHPPVPLVVPGTRRHDGGLVGAALVAMDGKDAA